MASRIGHDHQRIGGIVGAIVEYRRAELNCPLELTTLLIGGSHEEIEMDLLGDVAVRPRHSRQRLHLLHSEFGGACRIVDHDEVWVVVGTLTGSVWQPKELLPERSEGSPVLGIKARCDQLRRRFIHALIESIRGDTSSPNMRR